MERVGIDVRVQGRQAAEQDLRRIAAELRGLGADTRDAGGTLTSWPPTSTPRCAASSRRHAGPV